jgi:hypothetical protein
VWVDLISQRSQIKRELLNIFPGIDRRYYKEKIYWDLGWEH